MAQQKKSDAAQSETQKTEQKQPQMVTVNGDKITHAHCFKSNQSDDWFFTAKINGVPLKPQIMQKDDVEAVMNKTKSVQQMMETYFPSKIAPKVNPNDYKLPQAISTPEGDFVVSKFNVYKETDVKNVDYGKYRFYTQVGDKKMSCTASKKDLDAYFDMTTTPVKLIVKNFGDRLGMKEHYEQFRLPEGANIEAKNIFIKKNECTNRYEISVGIKDVGRTPAKELAYEDRQAYFSKSASKEQLAGKYLSSEISLLVKTPAQQQHQKMSMGV